MANFRLPPLRFAGGVMPVGIGCALFLGAVLLVSDAPLLKYPSRLFMEAVQLHTGKRTPEGSHPADFGHHQPSPDARHLADWIADSRDNSRLDFLIVDKKNATLYVFDAQARLRGSSPILLGAALGDESVPGIGSRPIAEVRPEERTTPAGRFLAERGHNARGEDVVWVDYDAAVSMHRVLRTNPQERRLERLASKSIADNRISWGCINVPVAFYENTVRPTVAVNHAMVYVLPDVKPVQQVFGSYDVGEKHRSQQAFSGYVTGS